MNLLGDTVTAVNYELKQRGDGKVNFTPSGHSDIGIQVKARTGSPNDIEWFIDAEEIQRNRALVCFLIQEAVS